MTRPEVTPTTEEAYAALLHLTDGDEGTDWTLLRFLESMMRQLHEVDVLVRDDDDFVGWGRIMDIDAVPREAIWWLGQFIGVPPISGLDEDSERLRVTEAAGWKRGSVKAMRGAARQRLTGERLVHIDERTMADGSPHPYHLRLTTFEANTPDADAVLRAVQDLLPAGLIFHYRLLPNVTYDQFANDWETYDAAAAQFTTYTQAAEYIPSEVI